MTIYGKSSSYDATNVMWRKLEARAMENNGMITSFTGNYRWLSNFAPAKVTLDGEVYPTVEHAYVAAKTLDPLVRKLVQEQATPGMAKRLGRKLSLRPDWDEVKLKVMEDLLRQKFRDSTYAMQLRRTGDMPIVEGNTWGDTFWGVCHGVGENHLGRLLMQLRSELAP